MAGVVSEDILVEPRSAEVFIQWKGTEVCLDFWCACGFDGHLDAMFAYQLRCTGCGRVWDMPQTVTLAEAQGDGHVPPLEPLAEESP